MGQISEEYIQQSEVEQGSIVAQPSPMSEAQYEYILSLLDTSILGTIQKDTIQECINGGITGDHAGRIITELLQVQRNPLDRVRDGELLLMSDLKTAVRRAVENPNT